MGSNIEISRSSKALPQCLPNLMPFHIQYTGPSPISTFFRVKEVTSFAGQSNADTLDEIDSAPKQGKSSFHQRLKAAFRGRVVCGLKVQMPEGYGGIVLRPNAIDSNGRDDASILRAKQDREVAHKRRSQRGKRAVTQVPEVIDVDEGQQLDEDICGNNYDNDDFANDTVNKRILQPIASFNSLVVWSPDIPVDEGKDEYIRALTEWTTIAAEINKEEEEEEG